MTTNRNEIETNHINDSYSINTISTVTSKRIQKCWNHWKPAAGTHKLNLCMFLLIEKDTKTRLTNVEIYLQKFKIYRLSRENVERSLYRLSRENVELQFHIFTWQPVAYLEKRVKQARKLSAGKQTNHQQQTKYLLHTSFTSFCSPINS